MVLQSYLSLHLARRMARIRSRRSCDGQRDGLYSHGDGSCRTLYAPKAGYTGRKVVEIAVASAVLDFNEGQNARKAERGCERESSSIAGAYQWTRNANERQSADAASPHTVYHATF